MTTGFTIVVNATAARESGALTILRQFLTSVENDSGQDRYIVFVPAGVDLKVGRENIRLVFVDTLRWSDRIAWDKKGFGLWLEAENVVPDLIISLQNTGVNYDKKVPQVIYYHQALSLERFRWNPLKSSERKYFLYKHIYPFFVRRYLDRATAVVVQRESLKALFSKKFGYPTDSIVVLRPDVPEIDTGDAESNLFRDGKIHFFYPATAPVYKNHHILVKAAGILKNKGYEGRFKIHLTGTENDFMPLAKKIRSLKLQDYFVFEGTMPFRKVLSIYNSSDALLFPSYIETFGLPLSEAMAFGLPIVCSDLPYAHEVLGDYPGAEYVTYNDACGWADAMERRLNHPHERFPHIRTSGKGDWNRFIELCRKIASGRK